MSEAIKTNADFTVINVATTSTRIPQYLRDRWRHGPQMNATLSGAMILSSAGMNMALGVGWAENGFYGWTKYFCYSWFVSVIIGTLLSAPLRIFVAKKCILAASGVLILIGGILFTSVPHKYDAMLVARYLNGIAVGLSIVPFLTHASEIAVDAYRGTCLLAEQLSVTFGMSTQMTYSAFWNSSSNLPAHVVHGIFDIIFGLLTCVFLIFFIESPIEHIREGDDAAALDCLSRLQRPQGVTTETRQLLEQHRTHVREQENVSLTESLRQGFVPLMKMLFFRSLMLVFCFSMPLNVTLKYSMALNGHVWAACVAGYCRNAGVILTFLLGDSVVRKLPSVIPVAFIGSLIIGLGSIFQNVESTSDYSAMMAAMVLYMFMQAFAGIFTPYTSVYMGEAFPMRVKPYLMDVCVIVEQILQIVFIETITVNVGVNLMVQGGITLVIFLFMCLMLPETRHTSLTEAQRRFGKWFYMKVK